MAPKSESSDGSSSDTELNQLMETSVGVALSLLGKRRAESPNPDDESGESDQISTDEAEGDGEEEEGVEEEEEEEEGDEDGVEFSEEEDEESREIDRTHELKWGYDSFEDRKYDSSDHKVLEDKVFEKQSRHYYRQVIETKGFFEVSDKFPPCNWSGVASIRDLEEVTDDGLTVRQFCANLTSTCLQRYNEENGLSVKLEHIKRVNVSPCAMSKFYITFAAKESDCPGAPLVEYQAKAVWCVSDKTYPIFCRPSPPPTRMMEEMN